MNLYSHKEKVKFKVKYQTFAGGFLDDLGCSTVGILCHHSRNPVQPRQLQGRAVVQAGSLPHIN